MKKTLIMAMAMALGVGATAFAANPFSDLPAGHWAYASVAKLAAAGIVDGYPDGTFKGQHTMTRYEMAQIVAKALAKGAIGADDKLVGEFADELDNLGVRVAKLEKHADNFKLTAQIRYMYEQQNRDNGKTEVSDVKHQIRTRLWFNGDINDNWKYVGMLENTHSFANDMETNAGKFTSIDNENNEGTAFQRAYLEGRLGGAKITAGRWNQKLLDGIIINNRVDGISATYGKKVKWNAFYERPTCENTYDFDKTWGVNVHADLGEQFTLRGGYMKLTDSARDKFADYGLWNAGIVYHPNDFTLGFDYLKSNLDVYHVAGGEASSNKGYVISASYKGAKPAKVGSYGFAVKYHHQGVGSFINPSVMGSDNNNAIKPFLASNQGFRGWTARAQYTIAKNVVAGLEYYDFHGLEDSKYHDKTLAGMLLFSI